MGNRHGDFIWYELMTSDADAAVAFYGAVLGWQSRRAEGSPMDYRIFGIAGEDVAGILPIPPDADHAQMRPGWLGYVAVDDVDAALAKVTAAGGARHVPPTDVPGVGRFALVADPQRVPFYLMRGAMEGESTAFAQAKAGHCHWNELAAADQ